MSSHFVSVLRQAFKTFDRSNQAAFSANFSLLKQLTEQLTSRDFHFQLDLFSESLFERPDKAPCTFVQIFENADISMSVFILRGNYTMPLHDHPMMHGILRGIYGKLQVLSYTQELTSNETLIYDKMARNINVLAEGPKIVSPDTECAVLTPRKCNFHEITAVGGVAAFFDILSPPYDTDIPIYGKRLCRFYQLSNTVIPTNKNSAICELSKTQLQLHRIQAPYSYYCDTAEAPEEVAECTFICSAEAYSS